jgi:hypothetical protein
VETSYDGYCTLLSCHCICRDHCEHLQVTVPGEARRDERVNGAELHGWCRACRLRVDAEHIRRLRPQRDARMAIYWLGEPDTSDDMSEAPVVPSTSAAEATLQLPLFPTAP